MEQIKSLVDKQLEQASVWFKHLHQNPELSFEEFETTKYIIEQLKNLSNITIETPTPTGCIAVLKGKNVGPTIGLRADIDALAVTEETDIDFKSTKPGVMHACGHDGHTSMLLAAATILNDYVDQIHGTIKFIFQPAEEMHPGGAIKFVETGALDDVDYFFATHIMPSIPTGKVALRPGVIFASSDIFDITIQGKGGHAAMPQTTVDPVIIMAEMVLAFQSVVSRKTNPLRRPILSTTVVQTPVGAENVIPDTIKIKGSVRNFDSDVRYETADWIKQLASDIPKAHNATADIDYEFGYAQVYNDDVPYEMTLAAAEQCFDKEDILILKDPIFASEDFGSYQKVAPGNYFLIGGGDESKQTNMSPHHPKYKCDEEAFRTGITMFLAIVDELLMEDK